MSIENRFAPARRKSKTNLATVRQEHPDANPKTTVAKNKQRECQHFVNGLAPARHKANARKIILCMLAGPVQTQTQQWLQVGEGTFNLKIGLRWPGANLWQTLLQTNEGGRGRTYTNPGADSTQCSKFQKAWLQLINFRGSLHNSFPDPKPPCLGKTHCKVKRPQLGPIYHS